MIHEHLGKGKDNARTGRELARLLHCNIRQIARGVEEERRAGWPICATSGGSCPGYFLAVSRSELEETRDRMKRRAAKITETADDMTMNTRPDNLSDRQHHADHEEDPEI